MKATIRGRSNGVSEGRDRRREARTASRARAPRPYDPPGADGWFSVHAPRRWLMNTCADGTAWEAMERIDCNEPRDSMIACAAEWYGFPMRLVMHADGRMVDPNCEEAKWL